MRESDEYRSTFFDRRGPDGLQYVRAFGFMLMIFGLTFGVLVSRVGFRWWVFPVSVAAGVVVGGVGFFLGEAAGAAYTTLMVDGGSTPYVGQYSYQQALVTQGRLDEALESFEAVINEKPEAPDPRIRAAELYAREKMNHQRAAELFRQVQRIESVTMGQFIHATNRLVDLYTGPLNELGKALVELRKLVEMFPGSPAARHAREAIGRIKPVAGRGP